VATDEKCLSAEGRDGSNEIPRIDLGPDLIITCARPMGEGATNSVWLCDGLSNGRRAKWFLKVADRSTRALNNEFAILQRLSLSSLPVPHVVRFLEGDHQVLLLTAVEGQMLWDLVDPRRPGFDTQSVPPLLRAYGACLGEIHRQPIPWTPELRARFYGLIGEQEVADPRFAVLVDWLSANEPTDRSMCFVHGDYNVANVMVSDGALTGIVDWEFSGIGWKEYEIAWSLRARTHFLGTMTERREVLEGYATVGSFDEKQLRYCEVLNYLHFAFWDIESDPEYASFSLQRAADVAGCTLPTA
jgi:aminoglycoside phosphotransferase (APT) family kinase protein